MCVDISVGIMTVCGLDNRGIVVRFPSKGKNYVFSSKASRSALELIHPMHLTRGALSLAVKGPDNKSNH